MLHDSNILTYLESIAESIPIPFYWVDTKTRWLGLNNITLAAVGGVNDKNDLIGKTPTETYNKDIGGELESWMHEVISSRNSSTKETRIVDRETGLFKYFLSTYDPLFNNDGEVIALLGTSIEITAEKESEKLRLEAAAAQAVITEQEKFRKFVQQVSHDIRSPISTLNMMLKHYNDFPEEVRFAFKNATVRLDDITTRLSQQYKSKNEDVGESNEILVSTALYDVLAEKKFEYADYNVNITSQFVGKGNFAFILADPVDFKRMLSNLINNAVAAFENKTGNIAIELKSINEEVQITISDNGKGMPDHVREAILNNQMITYGKEGGTGVGLTHARETIAKYNGRLSIKTEQNVGTQITVTFPKMKAPKWIAGKVELNYGDTVVILDDDESIHGAWDMLFKDLVADLSIRHYHYGIDAINFINSLEDKDKEKVYLLTDYELLKQDLNGIDVIEKTKVKRTILVTSHHMDKEIQAKAARHHTRIMPKPLAHEANIVFNSKSLPEQQSLFSNDSELMSTDSKKMQNFKKVDLVIVDDDEDVINNLKLFVLKGKSVDSYLEVDDFLKNVDIYSLDNKILVDYKFANNETMNGIDVIKILQKKGFTNCYLYSGMEFDDGDLPDGISVILKDKINEISSLFESVVETNTNSEYQNINVRQNELSLNSDSSSQNIIKSSAITSDLKKLAKDISHDLRTPIAGLESIIEFSDNLSETERLALKRLAGRFRDIAEDITHKYVKPNQNKERESIILVRNSLEGILHKNNYQNKTFNLTFDFKEAAANVAVKILPSIFNNMITDIINMSARSLENKGLDGKINIGLNINAEYAVISIEDNAGKFLNAGLIEQINKKETIDANNPENAHALQLAKIKQIIESTLGAMVIYYNEGARTKIVLKIPTVAAPNWLATQITLRTNDTLLIVTSNAEEFSNWQNKIKKECEQFDLSQTKQLKSFADILTFTENLSEEQLNRLVLIGSVQELSQYADRIKANKKQNMIKRTFITANKYEYENEHVSAAATTLGAKVIPDGLKSPIKAVFEHILKPGSKIVDMVWLDDEKMYIDEMIRKYYFNYVVDAYYDPNTFLDYVIQYPLNTKIFLDHNYYHNDNYKFDVNGISIAEKLHKNGYTNLFLLSGEIIENKPDYLKVILKTDTSALRNLDKL